MHPHATGSMTDEEKSPDAPNGWVTRPVVGELALAATQVTDTITVGPDVAFHPSTVNIHTGDSVTWLFPVGFTHTVTSGNPCTADATPLLDATSTFTHTFATPGTYPFLCKVTGHCAAGMFGSVVVTPPASVGPAAPRLGFVIPPAPNPSRSDVRFIYALESPGRARAEVFDVGGRRVAVLVDRDLAAGTYSATWGGAGRSGVGIYYLRLRLPGFDQTRRVVVRP